MLRASVILVISVVCAACAGRFDPSATPAFGLRIDDSVAASALRIEGPFDVAMAGAGDEIDIAVGFGRDSVPEGMSSRRAAGWDRIYALWLGPNGRWVSDPLFRRWIAWELDRESIVGVVFDGDAEPVLPEVDPVERRPFSSGSAPRFRVSYASDDRYAAALASRLRAALDRVGVDLQLAPDDGIEAEALILSFPARPTDHDAMVASLFAPLGARAGDALTRQTVERDGRLVPLVRQHAWIASADRTRAVRAPSFGLLDLSRIR